MADNVLIRTQTMAEHWPGADRSAATEALPTALDPERGFLARSVLALGLDTLWTRMDRQVIAVAGAGGWVRSSPRT